MLHFQILERWSLQFPPIFKNSNFASHYHIRKVSLREHIRPERAAEPHTLLYSSRYTHSAIHYCYYLTLLKLYHLFKHKHDHPCKCNQLLLRRLHVPKIEAGLHLRWWCTYRSWGIVLPPWGPQVLYFDDDPLWFRSDFLSVPRYVSCYLLCLCSTPP